MSRTTPDEMALSLRFYLAEYGEAAKQFKRKQAFDAIMDGTIDDIINACKNAQASHLTDDEIDEYRADGSDEDTDLRLLAEVAHERHCKFGEGYDQFVGLKKEARANKVSLGELLDRPGIRPTHLTWP